MIAAKANLQLRVPESLRMASVILSMSGRDDGQPFAAGAEIETDRIPLQSGRGRYGDPRKELPPFLQPPPRQERFPEGQRVRAEREL